MNNQATLIAFNKAYSQARTPFDLATAAHDVARTSWKLAQENVTQGRRTLALYHLKEAVSYYDKAVTHSAGCDLPDDFANELKMSFSACLQDVKAFVGQEKGYEARIPILETFKPLISTCMGIKADLLVEIATYIFRFGITVLDKGDYKKSLWCMKECYQPLEEARQWAGDQMDIHTEINVLEQDIFLNNCKAESLQCRGIGDALLEKSIKDDEQLNVTAVYEVMDHYKQSIIKAREVELEMEAIAHSRLGKVFAEVLKIDYKAKENYHRSIQIAHSLQPRTFVGVEWFQEARDFVEKYQQTRLTQETDKWQQDRKKFLTMLKKELELLEEKNAERKKKGNFEANKMFLKFIYKTHPPKKKNNFPKDDKLKKMEYCDMKQLFKTALIHYHPDRNKRHGKKWMTLCEELTKHITAIYEQFK